MPIDLAAEIRKMKKSPPRFANVSCSQCGESFGPGDSGFSHCDQHRPVDLFAMLDAADGALDRDTYDQFRVDNDMPDDAEVWVRAGTVRRINKVFAAIHAMRRAT